LHHINNHCHKNTHILPNEKDFHYIENEWCSVRLFKTDQFPGPIYDPFTEWGRVIKATKAAGYTTRATDITDRGYPLNAIVDFFTVTHLNPNTSIVGNPSFVDEILQHVIRLNSTKAALIWPFARLVAAWPWLATAPLAHVSMLTPRPAIPRGSYITAGNRPQGSVSSMHGRFF
jgi:hypothetical protein